LCFKVNICLFNNQENKLSFSWTTRYQQACSTRCGDGYKRVLYECTKTSYTDRTMEPMDEDVCRKYVGEKPKDVVSCVGDCTGTGWVYGSWGEVYFVFSLKEILLLLIVS
jgi:hypothetical protein